ncbi:MAG: hypothetical protein HY319_23270 [Armatimonadetes bacterium]|nr:hypothetical protein [Armatimonadota bacterium]
MRVALILNLLLAITTGAWAQETPRVQVNGAELREVRMAQEVIYVDVDAFLKLAGVPRAAVRISYPGDGKHYLHFNKKVTTIRVGTQWKGLYVDGKVFVEALGGSWIPSPGGPVTVYLSPQR